MQLTVWEFTIELIKYFWPLWIIAIMGTYIFIRDLIKKHRNKYVYKLQGR